MGEKKSYMVLSAIIHNHKRYEEGDTIDLLPEEAKALFAAKAIKGDARQGVSSGNVLESMVAAQNKQIRDLKLDLETALKINVELAEESSGLKKKVAELTSQVETLSITKGKGKK